MEVAETEDKPRHWTYDEMKVKKEDWAIYLMSKGAMDLIEALEG